MVIALGLITTVYGFYVLQSRVGTSGNWKALAQYGFLLLLVGNIGWILAQGLTFMLADAQSQQAVAAATSVYLAQSGIILLSGLAIAMGYMLFSLALSTRDDFNKPAALIVALVSVVVLVCYIIGISDNSQLDTMITIARYCYVVWVLWPIMPGLNLVMDNSPSSGS